MTPKDYLQQAYIIHCEINRALSKIEGMRQSLYGKGIDYSNDGNTQSNNDNALERAICKIVDYEKEVNERIDKLVDKKIEIEKVIAQLESQKLKEILERRYLLFEKWEQIAVVMDIDLRWIYRLHNKALNKLNNLIPLDH